MYAIKRCSHRLIREREIFTATWAALRPCRNNIFTPNLSSVIPSAGSQGSASRRFVSKLMDTEFRKSSTKVDMEDRLIWIDMEMTGLEVDTCHILEIACLITNSDLEIVSDDLHMVIHQPDEVLASMNPWCVEQHGKTGLTDASRASKISLKEAEELTFKFLAAHVPEKKCPIAGNSVWMDRVFLKKYMPRVDEYAHYRIVDVSTVKELTRRWCPSLYSVVPKKEFNHRALDDIRESISELQYYKSKVFHG